MSNQAKKINRQKKLNKAKNIRHNNSSASNKGPAKPLSLVELQKIKKDNKPVVKGVDEQVLDKVKDKMKKAASSLSGVVEKFKKVTC